MITKNRRTILVADSSMLARDRLEKILLDGGHRVVLASSGKQLVEIIRNRNNIDLLLMDMHLHKIDGLRMLEWMNNNLSRSFPTVCIASTNEMHTLLWKVKDLGATALITKSMPAEVILETINNVLFSHAQKSRDKKRKFTTIPAKFNLGTYDIHGNILNISAKGFFLHTNTNLLIGSKIKVNFTLPNKEKTTISTIGTVRWSTPKEKKESPFSGVGVEFQDSKSHLKTELNTFLV